MKVSIIVPVYNVEKYIQSCLESVGKQSMSQDVECLLVDDCGNDKSIEIAERALSTYNGKICFSIIHHKENKGLSAARNTGIRAARGEYLYFLDSDDEIKDNAIELMYSMAMKYNKVDLVQGAYDTDYPYMQIFKSIKYPEYSCDKKYIKSSLLNYDYMPTMAQNRLVKRDVIIKNKLFFKDGIIHEDLHWTFFLAKHIKSMCFCNIPTYFYRVTPGSITSSVNREKETKALTTIISDFCHNIDHELRGVQKTVILNHLVTYLRLRLYNGNEEKQKIIKLIRQNNTAVENILLSIYIIFNSTKTLHLLIRKYNW